MSEYMIGKMVEVHLLNGKRFLGKIQVKDDHGIILFCMSVKGLESVPPGEGAFDELREMVQTVFFPWQQIEYIDIGGDPIGFETIYGSWFHDISLTYFFEKTTFSEFYDGFGGDGNSNNKE